MGLTMAERKATASSSVDRVVHTSPRLVDLAVRHLDDILADIDEMRMWEQALESEPLPQIWIAGERVDAAFTAIAAFIDLKSPWFRGHSILPARVLAEVSPFGSRPTALRTDIIRAMRAGPGGSVRTPETAV